MDFTVIVTSVEIGGQRQISPGASRDRTEEKERTMNRRLMIALAWATIAMGGCATTLETHDKASSTGVSASPTVTSPAALPPNAFRPEVPHDFGSGGP
jgi:hypothetical protein